jgi:hypothetical protein
MTARCRSLREGLPLVEREMRLQALRQALIEGEESGQAGPLDMEEIKRTARAWPEVDSDPGVDPLPSPRT